MSTSPSSNPGSHKGGKYLYAIALEPHSHALDVLGLDRQPVYNVVGGRVTAVVSDIARDKVRPERAHLAAHKNVLTRLMQDSTVLPMAFGIIANTLQDVRRMLAAHEEDFLEQLQRVAGKVEMGLRVVWQAPNIFEYFIDCHPELREARDRLLGGLREPRQEEKLELGRFFDQLLEEDREAHFAKTQEVLDTCCDSIKRLPPRQVREVMNLSLLVERERLKDLDEAIVTAARLFDDNYAFDVNGPWAPHNFVEMNLQPGAAGVAESYAVR
jgi:Gas vesicle synthesis protein GvpL/GvpF